MDPRTAFALLWAAFFFHGMTAGMWVPALTNMLGAQGWQAWVPVVFMVPPLCTLVTPLVGGALADQRWPADRLYAWSSVASAFALAAAFTAMKSGWHPWWFIGLLAVHSLLAAPAWGILATISLTHLSHGARQFPLVRVGATIGWVAGGLATSHLLHADASPLAGHAAAVVRLLGGLLAFALPHTPPLGGRPAALSSRLGLDAFSLLKQRDYCVFFVVTALFSIPLAAFYMYAPEFLKVLGNASHGDDEHGASHGNRGDVAGGHGDDAFPDQDGPAVGAGSISRALRDERARRRSGQHGMAHRRHRAARGLLHVLFHHRAGVSGPAGEPGDEGAGARPAGDGFQRPRPLDRQPRLRLDARSFRHRRHPRLDVVLADPRGDDRRLLRLVRGVLPWLGETAGGLSACGRDHARKNHAESFRLPPAQLLSWP
jgi:hypothetical protein